MLDADAPFGTVIAIGRPGSPVEVQTPEGEQRLREQERIESLTVMAAGLAHDFNNLLTAILGNADSRKAIGALLSEAKQQAVELLRKVS